ncbi:acylneuraminate cytidylyltransferase [Stutzerimonas nitrititolerans]|uniref:acylneuraminate cytidylyltransferase n=1 Tax=Stutzerimonas nitrititolerans TaxID=2482751 RepID=UPI0028B22802|nr:acylneuraminate cytidylyltransferase [Stutzerimonas nitrititolerans]
MGDRSTHTASELIDTAEVVVIIPARGGSKGIPRKNLLRLCGHPLLAWSIWAARNARHVTRVIVSTDDDEIAEVSRQYGADVLMRPVEISGGKASSESALLHALEQLQQQGCNPELIVFLQATSPIRHARDVDGAVERLLNEQADSCFSACSEHFTGRWRYDVGDGVVPVNFQPGARPMRQDYPIEYLENGSIYVMRPDILRRQRSRMGGKVAVYPMNAVQSLQLDEPEDVPLIEACMSALSMREPQSCAVSRLRKMKLLVFDFDGVFTDNRVYVSSTGEESVCCSRSDSLGLDYLKKAGLEMLVLSTETSSVVAQRCRKLRLECLPGQGNKLDALQSVLIERGLQWDQIAYMGNDLNDLDCLRRVGLAIAPNDAHPEVLRTADLLTEQAGGHGAIRQVADWYLGDKREWR